MQNHVFLWEVVDCGSALEVVLNNPFLYVSDMYGPKLNCGWDEWNLLPLFKILPFVEILGGLAQQKK